MTQPPGSGPTPSDLRHARQRFIVSCPRRLEELQASARDAHEPAVRDELAQTAQRLVGAASVAGFSELSAAAGRLAVAASAGDDVPALGALVAALDEARARDELVTPEWVTPDDPTAPPGLTLLVADADSVQQLALTRFLEAAGHNVTALSRGDEVLAAVRRLRPALLVLDIQLPVVDGYTICRQVKADPALASVGVVFLTNAISTDDRLAGLLLGADDYIEKPVDLADVALRLATVADRRARAATQPLRLADGELSYAAFVDRAATLLQQTPGALVLLRMPADVGLRVATWLAGELRSDDLLGRYRDDLRILYLPGLVGRTAQRHVGDIVARLGASGLPVSSGVAIAERPGAQTLAALLQAADASLAASTASAPPPRPDTDATTATITVRRRSILVADDDEGTRLLATRPLLRAGLHVRTAVDGRDALTLLAAEVPEVLVLDLSMPHVDGLGVLQALQRRGGPRPRVIVVSANREEEDIRRALELGADDYLVKPFNPLMLLARVRRQLH